MDHPRHSSQSDHSSRSMGDPKERHNKTQKKITDSIDQKNEIEMNPNESFRVLLETGAREAYTRQWHRLERGLRLNRIRLFIEDISPQFSLDKDEKDQLFLYLQKALDKKLLNTLKVVVYDQSTQRITTIKGLDIKRNPNHTIQIDFSTKKQRTDTTRKKKKGDELPSVSTDLKNKIEEKE
jgi:hypothetical protein